MGQSSQKGWNCGNHGASTSPTETFRPSGCDLPLTRRERQQLNVLCRSRKKRRRDSWPLPMRNFNRTYFLQWFCQRGFNELILFTVQSERRINFHHEADGTILVKVCLSLAAENLCWRRKIFRIFVNHTFVKIFFNGNCWRQGDW